jgi:hypothetical protein
VDLIVQNTEIAKTLKNGQEIKIAKTLNNGQEEEDLLIESTMYEEASQEAVEASLSYGKTVTEARKAVVNKLSPLLWLDKPEHEKLLKDYVLEHYYGYLDFFTEKEAIPLPLHQPWDHVITLTSDAPPSIPCRVYPLSYREQEFQERYIKE